MKASTKDQTKGTVHEIKGTVKETVGHLTNDSDSEAEGHGEKIAGKFQKKMGQLEKVLEK